MEYDESICCLDAEQDLIWSNSFLYKREHYPKKKISEETLDISHLHQDWWMYPDVPF